MANPLNRQAQVFGNAPSSLTNPAPVETAAPLEAPEVPTQQTVAQNAPPEDEFAEFGIGATAAAPAEDEFAEFGIGEAVPQEPELQEQTATFDQMREQLGTTEAVKQTLDRGFTRFRLGFAANDTERLNELQQKLGEDRAQMIDGELYVRYPGMKDFERFDPDSEGLAEVLDWGRFLVEAGTEEAATVAGVGAATVGTGGPGALAAGGIASGSAVLGLQVGDFIAENIMQIERDPKRSKTKEAAIAAAFGVASGALANKLARKATEKALISTDDALQAATDAEKAATNLQEGLAKRGISIKEEGNRMILSPGQQLGPNRPEGTVFDKSLSDEGPVRQFFIKQGEMFQDAYRKLVQSATNVTGDSADDLFKSVKNTGQFTKKVEGKLIEGFRSAALKASKGEARQLPRTVERIGDAIERFGGRIQTVKDTSGRVRQVIKFDNPELVITNMFPDASKGQIVRAQDLLKRMGEEALAGSGSLNLRRVDNYYSQLKAVVNSTAGSQKNGGIARSLFDLKDGLRDDWTDIIGQELPEGSKELYRASLTKYHNILKAQKSLRGILGKDEFSRKAFANKIFDGTQSKASVQNIKTLIKEQSPELWDQMRSEYLTGILDRAAGEGAKAGRSAERAVNWKSVRAEVDKLKSAEIYNEMFDGDKMAGKLFDQFLDTAQKIDNFDFTPKQLQSKGALSKLRSGFILAARVSGVAKMSEAEKLFLSMSKSAAMKKWLAGEGTELILKGVPKEQKRPVRLLINRVIKAGARTGTRKELEEQFGQVPEMNSL